jgi:hypothetical protein
MCIMVYTSFLKIVFKIITPNQNLYEILHFPHALHNLQILNLNKTRYSTRTANRKRVAA